MFCKPLTEKPRLVVASYVARSNTAPIRARSHSEPPPSKSLDSVSPRSILKDTKKSIRQDKEPKDEESINSSRSNSPVGYTIAFKKSTQRLHFDPGVYLHFKEIDQAKDWQESKYKKKGSKNRVFSFESIVT